MPTPKKDETPQTVVAPALVVSPPAGSSGAVTVDLTQDGRSPATATVTVTPAAPTETPPPLGPGWTVVGKFLDPSAIAALAATGVGMWMLIYQPEREVTSWALIAAGGLLVPALGTIKRLTGGVVGK